MSDLQYLARLPEQYRYLGRSELGEIAIVPRADRDSDTGIVFEDQYVLLVRDAVVLPDGREGTYLRLFERASLSGQTGVVIVPTFQGNVVLVRIFRHAVRDWAMELPRGYRDETESLEDAARREIAEEIGVEASAVKHLGVVQPNSAILASEIAVVTAELSQAPDTARSAPGDAIAGLVLKSDSGVQEAVRLGDIKDSLSIAAFCMYAASRGSGSVQ